MDALDILSDASARPLQALDEFIGQLDAGLLNAHPGNHPNSVAWLLWHAARQWDGQLSALSARPPV